MPYADDIRGNLDRRGGRAAKASFERECSKFLSDKNVLPPCNLVFSYILGAR